jgi:hypothetical protein
MAGAGIGPPAIIAHSRDQALVAAAVAAELGRPLVLRSPPGAASSHGVGWFVAMAAQLRERYPALDLTLVLDCGDEAGTAMAALRRGIERVRFTGPAEVAGRLAGIAAAAGAMLDEDRRPPLDLAGESEVEKRCRDWLG